MLEILLGWLAIGMLCKWILILLITEGGKRPFNYRWTTLVIVTILWPVAIIILVKHNRKKQQRKDKKQYPKDYFYY